MHFKHNIALVKNRRRKITGHISVDPRKQKVDGVCRCRGRPEEDRLCHLEFLGRKHIFLFVVTIVYF